MKATGIVRKLDQLGRIVIPKELRDMHKLVEGTPIEIFVEGGDIIFRKYQPECIFCGEAEGVTSFEGKNVCKNCLVRIKKL